MSEPNLVRLSEVLDQEGVVVQQRGIVTHITLPFPRIGGKVWVLDAKGIFVLERSAGVLRTIACTHAGSGAVLAYDGIPDDRGFFSPRGGSDGGGSGSGNGSADEDTKNGREIYRANPAVMGSWMLDGGFYHGLTIVHNGGHSSAPAVASIVWLPANGKASS
jgi:hypothetical protein